MYAIQEGAAGEADEARGPRPVPTTDREGERDEGALDSVDGHAITRYGKGSSGASDRPRRIGPRFEAGRTTRRSRVTTAVRARRMPPLFWPPTPYQAVRSLEGGELSAECDIANGRLLESRQTPNDKRA